MVEQQHGRARHREGREVYADEALTLVNAGEVEDKPRALKQIKRAATWLALIEANDVARSVRRRVAVADGVAPAEKASSDAA